GLTTCATLPPGVPTGGQGPRLQAVLALMTGAYRLSKRMAQTLCADVLGVPVCAGQVCVSEAQTAALAWRMVRTGADARGGRAGGGAGRAVAGERLRVLMGSATFRGGGEDSRRGPRGGQEDCSFPNGISASVVAAASRQ